MNIQNFQRKSRRKSLLGTHCKFNRELFPKPTFIERTTRQRSLKIIVSPVKTSSDNNDNTILEAIVSPVKTSSDNNDNTILEAVVSPLKTSSDNNDNTILEAIVSSGKTSSDNNDNTILETTINKTLTYKKPYNDITDTNEVLSIVDLLLEKEIQCIEDLKTKIAESKTKIENLKQIKLIISGKNKLNRELFTISELKSPVTIHSPSKQIIKEIQSTLKFLKTPRANKFPRNSIILTPHSMAFSIKTQYEELLE